MTLKTFANEDNEFSQEEDSNEDFSESEESNEDYESDEEGGLFVEGYVGEEQTHKPRKRSTNMKKKKQHKSVNLPK